MHTSRKPQCFNELQNRTNWSCSDRTFTISPIFRAKRIPAETALQVKTEMCASTRASPWGTIRPRRAFLGPTGQPIPLVGNLRALRPRARIIGCTSQFWD
jgi:hypothetical protein